MKLIFTLLLAVLVVLGNAQTLDIDATSVQTIGTGGNWSPTTGLPVTSPNLNNGNPESPIGIARFDFSALPANITISGFQVEITRWATATNNVTETLVSLAKNTTTFENKRVLGLFWPGTSSTSATTQAYGSTTDLWGTTWTRAELNNTFGVAFRVQRASGNQNATVTRVRLIVTYQTLAPIILTRFELSRTAENYVSIQFATSSEERVRNIFVERSADGRNFSPIFTIVPQGARNRVTNYNMLDKTPLPGTNYYRLKEIDYDGKASYFEIKAISIAKGGPRFQAFYSGSDIKVNLSGMKGSFVVMLHDAAGNMLSSKSLNINTASLQTTLPAPLRSGVYTVTMRGDGISESSRIFIAK